MLDRQMNDNDRDALIENSAEALRKSIHSHTIAIVAKRSELEQGTGTCIKIGKHYLIASVSHLVAGCGLPDLRLVHSRKPTTDSFPIKSFGCRGEVNGQDVDIAWLELEEGVATGLGREFYSIDDLLPYQNTVPDDFAIVSGYPRDLNRLDLKIRNLGVQPISYFTYTLPTSEWPKEYDPEFDLVLAYNEKAVRVVGGEDFSMPNAKGFSGGSIWVCKIAPKPDGIWNPGLAKMIGIQKSWREKARIVRGTQIQHWLQMVLEDFPDVESEVKPFLNSSGRP